MPLPCKDPLGAGVPCPCDRCVREALERAKRAQEWTRGAELRAQHRLLQDYITSLELALEDARAQLLVFETCNPGL